MRLLLALLVTCSPSAAAPPAVAFVGSGDGFRATTTTMAFARATESLGGWPHVTHIGGVSGSSWFSSLFLYSHSFFENVTNTDMPLSDVIQAWGTAMARPQNENSGSGLSDNISDYQPWIDFTYSILNSGIEGLGSATYSSATRANLITATLVQGASLPPSAWLYDVPLLYSPSKEKNSTNLLIGGSSINFEVPVAWVDPGLNSALLPGWTYNASDELSIGAPAIPGTPGKPGTPATSVPLQLPEDPLLLTTSSGSSSAEGFMSGPVTLNQFCGLLFGTPKCAGAYTETMKSSTFQRGSYATPLAGMKGTWPSYVLFDGAYTENLGVAWTLSQMQLECASTSSQPSFDCASPFRFILIDNSVADQNQSSFTTLFAQPGITPGMIVPGIQFGFTYSPAPIIFAESFPAKEFKPYVVSDSNNGTSSTYWIGTLTTVDNTWYKIKGGQAVRVAMFSPNQITPMMENPTDVSLFTQTFGPPAENQALYAKPILESFLSESINVRESAHNEKRSRGQ